MKHRLVQILKTLPGFPQIQSFYREMNYLFFVKKNVRSVLDPNVSLVDIDEPTDFFFGYYDKSPWPQDDRAAGRNASDRVLYHRLVGRTGTPDGKTAVEIVCRNLSDNSSRVLGTTVAWNWQQGAMLQWLPGDDDLVVFNQLSKDGSLVAEIRHTDIREQSCDPQQGELVKQLPMPIQTLRKDGKAAISLNYRRLAGLRPCYGYFCDATNFSPDQPDDRDGLFLIDMESGKTSVAGRNAPELVVSIEKLKNIHDFPRLDNPRHKVNHAMYAPYDCTGGNKGNRLVFMHRCLHERGKKDRLYLVNDDGTDLKLLLDEDMVSHYSWMSPSSLVCYCRTYKDGDGYYEINVDTGAIKPLGQQREQCNPQHSLWQYGDGHPSLSPCGRYIVTDTYPDHVRMQRLLLYDMQNATTRELARFFSPFRFHGTKRCDFHPRWSPDGRFVSIDTVETGQRKMRLLDVSRFV